MTAPRHPVRLAEAALLAFQALGYSIVSTGSNTYRGTALRRPSLEAIQAYARIEEALRRWRST